jgi:hypothetical protein
MAYDSDHMFQLRQRYADATGEYYGQESQTRILMSSLPSPYTAESMDQLVRQMMAESTAHEHLKNTRQEGVEYLRKYLPNAE